MSDDGLDCPVCGEGYPAGSPWIREPVFISEPRILEGGETFEAKFTAPAFSGKRRFRWLLVEDLPE